MSFSLTGNLEVLPSAKSKKLAIKPNGILFILPFGFIPRSARRTSTSSAKKTLWNWVFRGPPRPKNRDLLLGAASMKKFGLILKHLEASLQRFFVELCATACAERGQRTLAHPRTTPRAARKGAL
ncbi:TPA: hypothetical protein DGH83_00575 [Candidatus Peregrinibacteria bacterium]|nr:hypothetical protein [Candidatus Peregrinibacteria bacterium]